jgi:tetratricopeptide (TPR) repeat protein
MFNFTKKISNDKQAVANLGYQITYEALPHQSIKALPYQVQAEVQKLYKLMRNSPEQAISPLVKLITKYPQVPVLYNYLKASYDATGQSDKSEVLLEQLYRKYPDYLFAKTQYAFRCLRLGSLEQIPIIFQNKFDLKMLYPNREVFHISEFTAFTGLMALYHQSIEDSRTAKKHYWRLKNLAPAHKLTAVIQSQIYPSFFHQLICYFDEHFNQQTYCKYF